MYQAMIKIHSYTFSALAIVTGLRKPWDELSDSDSDSGSDSDEEGNATQQDSTELRQLLENLKSTVTCLFRLSMAVRDPAPESQHRSTITVDKSYFEEHDIMHVKAKFPSCDDNLADRLGRAISGRRQYLSYREEHHQKLAKNIESLGFEEPKTEHTSNSTEATPLPAAHTNNFDVLDGDDALSQTSYASSANSNATIRVPPLPKEAHDQEHFECPLCFMIVSIHTTLGWKQHVYKDLHPYCCTFDSCTTAERLYDSRHDWFNHELEAHRASWQCVEGCDKTFPTRTSFETHVSTQHLDLASPSMLSALRDTSRKPAELSMRVRCPLCALSLNLRTFQRHVGKHQEQLALFALPPKLDDTEDETHDNESDSDSVFLDTSSAAPDATSGEEEEEEKEDVFTIKCICGFSDDDGNIVLCEKCTTWQHIVCYYESVDHVKWVHECTDCLPRAIDTNSAVEKQRQRRGLHNAGVITKANVLDNNAETRSPDEEGDDSAWNREKEERSIQSKDAEQSHDTFGARDEPKIAPLAQNGLNPPHLGQQPTYIKVHREHLAIETLHYYKLPYEYDKSNSDYIIIMRELRERETEILFEHTRRLRTRDHSSFLFQKRDDSSSLNGIQSHEVVTNTTHFPSATVETNLDGHTKQRSPLLSPDLDPQARGRTGRMPNEWDIEDELEELRLKNQEQRNVGEMVAQTSAGMTGKRVA
jgi:hypothetical protein